MAEVTGSSCRPPVTLDVFGSGSEEKGSPGVSQRQPGCPPGAPGPGGDTDAAAGCTMQSMPKTLA